MGTTWRDKRDRDPGTPRAAHRTECVEHSRGAESGFKEGPALNQMLHVERAGICIQWFFFCLSLSIFRITDRCNAKDSAGIAFANVSSFAQR